MALCGYRKLSKSVETASTPSASSPTATSIHAARRSSSAPRWTAPGADAGPNCLRPLERRAMNPLSPNRAIPPDVGREEAAGAAAAALGVFRRALLSGVPVTREAPGQEASFILDSPLPD